MQLCNQIFNLSSEWFSHNMLVLNIKKTNFMIIGKVTNNQCLTLTFNNGLINKVSSVRYLGFVLDDKLSWKNILYVIDKCSKRIGMIKCAHNLLPISCLLSLYYTFMYPYIQSSVEIYGNACKKCVDKLKIIQKSCIRAMLFAKSTVHCMPFAKYLHLLLFDDLLYVRTLSFKHNVYCSNVCHIINYLFFRLPSLHSYSTRSNSYKFYLNHAVNNACKNFITFHGVVLWNNLAISIKELSTLSKFKLKLVSTIFEMHILFICLIYLLICVCINFLFNLFNYLIL